jgi:eukaryotic-like serine/threonine-protein kinase
MLQPLLHQPDEMIQDRYHLAEVLGQGGIGTTYRARDVESDRWVAIKVVSLRQMKGWKTLDLLEREIKVLQALDHPAIPRYFDSFEIDQLDNRVFYLVQELAPGQSLANWVAEGWRPDEDEVQDMAEQLLGILSYLQTLTPPVIHRDIKPHNIIRDRSGKLYLVDFGAVQDTVRHTITGGSTVVGTLGYMAPEQFRGQATLTTDLYGLGTTLIFLLTGIDPIALPEKNLRLDFRRCCKVRPDFAQWLDGLIAPATEARCPNAQSALAMLRGDRPLLPNIETESIRHRRITVQRSADRLDIQIAPAGWQQPVVQLLGGLAIAYGIMLSLWIWLLGVTPYLMDSLNFFHWLGMSIVIGGGGLLAYGIGLGIWSRSRLSFTPQSLGIRQDWTIDLQVPSRTIYACESTPIDLPHFGRFLAVHRLTGSQERFYLFGFFLSKAESDLLLKQFNAFLKDVRLSETRI